MEYEDLLLNISSDFTTDYSRMCGLWIYLDDEWSTSGDVATVDVVLIFVVDFAGLVVAWNSSTPCKGFV